MKPEHIAKWEGRFRPLLTKLPSSFVVALYSKGRQRFLADLAREAPKAYTPPDHFARELWGIRFNSPIMNAAGMFKNGDGYELVLAQGAGGYLGGTSTWNPREGNRKNGVRLPFAPYPHSHAASNWLGLPNDGDVAIAFRVSTLQPRQGCPIGWSLMGSPDFEGDEKLQHLVQGMKRYAQAGVSFLEINESCPNTGHSPQNDGLAERLTYLKEQFLDQRERALPVVVKFSNDTDLAQVPALLDLLFELGYDGVNFGNTSTDYEGRRALIHPRDLKLFDYFTQTFGGGVSGKPLKESSLELCAKAAEHLRAGGPTQEFHVIRTGGVESLVDLDDSIRAGVSLNQWYTGYFERFATFGHDVYASLFEP